LAGEIDRLVWPFTRVIDSTGKCLEAVEMRRVSRRQTARRHDAESR